MSTLMRRAIGPLTVAAAGVGMALWTWGTWPDPVTDFGKEVYLAWQLSQGRRLYIDVAYHLGPLSSAINAAAFKIFGASLATIFILNFCILALIAALMYRLIARLAGQFAAAVTGVVFMTLFAFVHFTPIADYNFIAPYDHAHTHGLLLGLLGLTAADGFARTGRRWMLIATGLTIGLVFLTRAELFVAATAGVGVTLILSRRKIAPIPALVALLVLSFPILIAAAFTGWRGVVGSWPIVFNSSVTGNSFYRDSMGTLNLSTSLLRLAKWTGCWIVIFLPPFLAGKRAPQSMPVSIAAFLWAAAIAFAAGWFFNAADAFAPLPLALLACAFPPLHVLRERAGVRVHSINPVHNTLGDAPLFPSSGIPGEGWGGGSRGVAQPRPNPLPSPPPEYRKRETEASAKLLRTPINRESIPLALGTMVWSLALLGKILLNARIYHYGFALAMPATLIVVAIAIGWTSRPVRAAVLGALAVAVAGYLTLASSLMANQKYIVGEGGNQFLADQRGLAMSQILQELRQRASQGQTLAVMPEGAMLNFLAAMPNSTPYWSFNPPYSFFAPGQGEAAGEQKMLDALNAHPPDWIVLVKEDLSDFGTPFFGVDYGKSLYGFVRQDYVTDSGRQLGDRPFGDNEADMMLLRRQRYNGH